MNLNFSYRYGETNLPLRRDKFILQSNLKM